MDRMWWEIGGFCDGRLRLKLVLFGNETDRLKTPTIVFETLNETFFFVCFGFRESEEM